MLILCCLSLPLGACQVAATSDGVGYGSAPATVIAREPHRRVHHNGDLTDRAAQYHALAPLFDTARQLVERQLGVSLRSVSLQVTGDDDIAREVRHETARLVDAQFRDEAFATHFLDAVMRGQSGTFVALYSHRRNAVLASNELLNHYRESVGAGAERTDNAILALLIHELVHAADDQRFDIAGNRELNFRASFAESAVFEGHAQWVTREICDIALCRDGIDALDRFMFGDQAAPNQIAQSVEAISRNILEYSYVEGERFIAGLAARDDGEALLDAVLADPPSDPVAILDPGAFPDGMRHSRNEALIAALTGIDHPWRSAPWAMVQTSPLKGVNLRSDPVRRDAAVQGFTQLITAMVSMQVYHQLQLDRLPIDITVLQTTDDHTAALFAETLHDGKAAGPADRQFMRNEVLGNEAFGNGDGGVATLLGTTTGDGDHSLVALHGRYVVQLSGPALQAEAMRRYALGLLARLSLTPA